MTNSTFITRVVLKNYKSIAACDIALQPLTFLVGPNGAGKSNFLDALRFVTDALNSSLEHAIRDRGGINDVRRRSHGHPNHFSIGLQFTLPDKRTGHYGFSIGARSRGAYEVQKETCVFQGRYFHLDKGSVVSTNVQGAPAAVTDRLYLVNASGLSEFRPVYDALARMGFYNLNPDSIRDLQAPDPRDVLARDGSNLTSMLNRLSPQTRQDIEEYLAAVVPGISGVDIKKFGPRETLEFRQDMAGAKYPWRFLANNMSDGTLRVLGILVALFQEDSQGQKRVPLVGIEEPEVALHPAAAGVLLDGIRDAAERTQVVLTSHSPDLLDNKELNVDSILAVRVNKGNTEIAQIDEASRSVLKEELFTTGELLRLDQLEPDPAAVAAAKKQKDFLFDLKKFNSNQSKDKENHG